MATNLQQTDTAPAFGAAAYCSGASAIAGAPAIQRANDGAGAGSTEDTFSITNLETDRRAMYHEYDIQSGYDGASGNWTIKVNVTSITLPCTWKAVYVCRVNSAGVNQETLGALTGLSDAIATGVKTFTVSQASGSTFAAGDKVMVVFVISGPVTMGTSSIGVTPDQVSVAPGSVAGSGTQPVRTMAQMRRRRAA